MSVGAVRVVILLGQGDAVGVCRVSGSRRGAGNWLLLFRGLCRVKVNIASVAVWNAYSLHGKIPQDDIVAEDRVDGPKWWPAA